MVHRIPLPHTHVRAHAERHEVLPVLALLVPHLAEAVGVERLRVCPAHAVGGVYGWDDEGAGGCGVGGGEREGVLADVGDDGGGWAQAKDLAHDLARIGHLGQHVRGDGGGAVGADAVLLGDDALEDGGVLAEEVEGKGEGGGGGVLRGEEEVQHHLGHLQVGRVRGTGSGRGLRVGDHPAPQGHSQRDTVSDGRPGVCAGGACSLCLPSVCACVCVCMCV